MPFNLVDYYKALNGESSLTSGTWYVNYNKRHAFSIFSDYDALDGSIERMILPPSEQQTEIINIFSDKLNQKIVNTKISTDDDGTEKVELELEDRIVTIIIDQSGSATWNDNGTFRHEVAKDLVDKIDINYPGDVKYNLIKYGSDPITVLFFGVIDEEGINPYNVNTLAAMLQADEDANYDGIRIVRKEGSYPTAVGGIDGEIVQEGFMSKILDSDLTTGQTYYYKVYTYDKDWRFSNGVEIKVTPRERVVPRGVSIFRTPVDSADLTKGIPYTGSGVNKDENVIGLWHMDEGEGRYLYDFSDSNLVLTYTDENPVWYDTRFVPAGTSGLFFDGQGGSASVLDSNNLAEVSFSGADNQLTVGMWVYPYSVNSILISRDNGTLYNYSLSMNSSRYLLCIVGQKFATSTVLQLETYKWQYAAFSYGGGATVDIYLAKDGQLLSETQALSGSPIHTPSSYTVYIGGSGVSNYPFRGRITEVSIHNTVRSLAYMQSQLVERTITRDGVEVDTEYIGIKEDNGDRLVVLDYEVPDDYNFSGGEVIIVKNEKHIPSWEEDGTVIYQEIAASGQYFVSDSNDFALGETYYYRIFSKNSTGNVSFLTDSPSLEINIPASTTDDYFLSLSSTIPAPQEPTFGQLITAGNEKIYLRWEQDSPVDSEISRVKIYYSPTTYPVVDTSGYSDGTLVFTGLPTDEKFVHRNLTNNVAAYYTIVNVDKYGRSSNYDTDGVQVEDFLHAVTSPSASADEGTIPLVDVDNLYYELVDDNTISVGWNQPVKSPENINSYFDQTVLLYASITDEFGSAISENTPIKMYINADITREDQAEDVFTLEPLPTFNDTDAYDFFVNRTDEGFIKATLRMTADSRIISQIKNVTFTVQLKAYLPKEGGYTAPNTDVSSTTSLVEYTSNSGDNIFEYYSSPITVYFTNPWEIELENKDDKKVYQRCYVQKQDRITGEKYLVEKREYFNGIHMKTSVPFVARVKVKYKGEVVESGNLQIAVWDADATDLCKNASFETSDSYEGEKLEVSQTVSPPNGIMPIVQGTEEQMNYYGQLENVPISYVDIPLYATDLPQAVRLFVKGTQSGYSSVKNMYILFQNILYIDITANQPEIDGKDVAEQIANVFIINPDYPNYETNDYDKSLVTYPSDQTVVEWNIEKIAGGNDRTIYSIDNVPVTNGIYSYTRNGVARNVFLGPIPKEDEKIEEVHEINAEVVYDGLTVRAKQYIYLEYDPLIYDKFGARFLMEINGGWRGTTGNETWGGGGWLISDYNPLWTDGTHYKRIGISRDPLNASISDFASANCFRSCASRDDSQLLELNSGQVINITTNDNTIEILHGEIYEETDPYTGEHSLRVGESGYIDNSSTFIELNDEEDSDITYFYIRANKFMLESGRVWNSECDFINSINDCLCLSSNTDIGLTQCDLPEWNPVLYISGTTTLFVNNEPLVLRGGGDFCTGIPPCPICLLEPLSLEVVWRRVTNYFYSLTLGDPSNDYIYSVVTKVGDNNFEDENEETLITHDSDVDIRMKVLWKGETVPLNTPVYISIGDNSGNTAFVATRNIYYTQIHSDEGYSYVDVRVSAREIADETVTEQLEIYSDYDENGRTTRHMGEIFNLTLDKKDVIIETPVFEPDPSVPEVVLPSAFSATLEKYDILTNEWTTLTGMSENRGNVFGGTVGDKIYVIGGLKNNSLNISNRNEEYNIASDGWSNKNIMPAARFGGMSVTLGSDIYIIGGIAANSKVGGELTVTTLVEVYHTNTDVWEELSSMPIVNEGEWNEEELGVAFGAAQHVEINAKNYIYIVGGVQRAIVASSQFEFRSFSQRILRYCIEDDTWEYSDILRTNELSDYERISPLTILYEDKLIVFNGAIESGNEFIYPVDNFYIGIAETFSTPLSGEWLNFGDKLLDEFPVAKFQSSMVKYDINPSTDPGTYYILGGANKDASSLNIVEKIVAQDILFGYENSYDGNPSVLLTHLITAKHGALAVYSDAIGTPSIYLVGGYTPATEDEFIDISFDI